MMINNILIICTGNICRSPMAEGLLNHRLTQAKPNMQVSSAGIAAMVSHTADPFAQQIMKEQKGIDISMHRARQINIEIIFSADLILVMESFQQKKLEYNFPNIYGRVHRLGKWSGFDIPDPYQRSLQVFEQTLVLIEQCIEDWKIHLLN